MSIYTITANQDGIIPPIRDVNYVTQGTNIFYLIWKMV
jgi:hypothetical protein